MRAIKEILSVSGRIFFLYLCHLGFWCFITCILAISGGTDFSFSVMNTLSIVTAFIHIVYERGKQIM